MFSQISSNVNNYSSYLLEVKRYLFLVLPLVLFMSSCSEEDYEYVDKSPQVIALYIADGLGDRSYVDNIYRGVEAACIKNGLYVLHLSPADADEGRAYIENILRYGYNDGIKRLFLVTDQSYTDVLKDNADLIPDNDDMKMVFFETRPFTTNAYTLYVPFYGGMYAAGYLAQTMEDVDSVAIFSANVSIPALVDSRKAFMEGFTVNGKETIENYYLGEGTEGFAAADTLYKVSYMVDSLYDMVLPLCGGSVQGLLRYNREYPTTSFYTVGVDADMSSYSSRVPFSCVKHMDDVVDLVVSQWLSDSLPRHQTLGMKEGYVEVIIPDDYKERFESYYSEIFETAVQKEEDYEATQQE